MTKREMTRRIEKLEQTLTETREYLVETRAALLTHMRMDQEQKNTEQR